MDEGGTEERGFRMTRLLTEKSSRGARRKGFPLSLENGPKAWKPGFGDCQWAGSPFLLIASVPQGVSATSHLHLSPLSSPILNPEWLSVVT